MTDSEDRAKATARIVKWLKIGIVAVVIVSCVFIGANRVTAYRACESSRKDRLDAAKFLNTHRWYIQQVTGAASVKEDVKSAARTAQLTYTRIGKRLTKRADINCNRLIP